MKRGCKDRRKTQIIAACGGLEENLVCYAATIAEEVRLKDHSQAVRRDAMIDVPSK
jgi:hypothetical protein